jgi:predicted alpha/beta-fold hydrolase
MKKITNMHGLRQEQKAVEQRGRQLEKELHRDWYDIKKVFITGDHSFFSQLKKQYVHNMVAQGLSFGAGMLTKKIGGKIGSMLFSWLH